MEVTFDEMIGKLRSGEWSKATTHFWQERDGQYLSMEKTDGRMKLIIHEDHDHQMPWGLRLNDAMNLKFIELKL